MFPELLVVSDTHGDVDTLAMILSWARKRGCLALAFLGDGQTDPDRAFQRLGFRLPCMQVKGNNDWEGNLPASLTFEFSGRTFFITHGHLASVSTSLGPLVAAAKSVGADAALYGHTHKPFWEEMDGLLVLNPGSPSRPRGASGPGFATIVCPPDGWFEIHQWSLGDGFLGGRRFSPL